MESQCIALIARAADLTILFQSGPPLQAPGSVWWQTYKHAYQVSRRRHHAMYDAWLPSQKSPPGHRLLAIPPRLLLCGLVHPPLQLRRCRREGNRLSEVCTLVMEDQTRGGYIHACAPRKPGAGIQAWAAEGLGKQNKPFRCLYRDTMRRRAQSATRNAAKTTSQNPHL